MAATGQDRHLALTVGTNLRAARKALGLNQREFAAKVAPELGGKTDGQRISDWERGRNRPSDLSLIKLAEVLGKDIAWFYTDHEVTSVAA